MTGKADISPPLPLAPPAVESPAQLLCGSTSQAANVAACNLMLFSDDFRAQYSDEEQVHMIRVLLGLQIRNFRQLLARVGDVAQVQKSKARAAKINSMLARLGRGSSDIDAAMNAIINEISTI